jgi:DNA-binding transcriptional LysR family regulator
MDRLASMRVFVKVVELGSFARAAAALDMSAAVVTRSLADLETHLGTRLLNRTTRRLSLTETGQQYVERVRHILADIDDADAIAASSARAPSGTLRIYCQPGFGQAQLSALLPRFAALMPGVVLDVTLSDHAVDLVREGFDVGIFIDLQKFDNSLIARRLATSSVVLCASPDYIARHGAPSTAEEVSAHPCLNFAYEQLRHHWMLQVDGGTVNIPIKSRMVSNSGPVLRQAALAGMGIMLQPSFTVKDDFDCGRLVRLLTCCDVAQLSVMLVYPSRRLLSAKVRGFVDFMVAEFPHPERDPWQFGA